MSDRMVLLRGAAPALTALLATGCAQNSLLELYVEVPPQILIVTDPPGPMRMATHVRLAVVAAGADPMTDISGSDSQVFPLRTGLSPADESWVGVTLAREDLPPAGSDQLTTVRVIYCPSATECGRESRLGFRDIVIDHGFYTARRTCYAHFLDDDDYSDGLALPATQDEVTPCAIGGCTDSDFMMIPNFCDTGGAHFCLESNRGAYCDELRERIGDGLIEP